MSKFKDKVVIVTGASKGIGEGTALAFAKQGSKLALVGRNGERLKNVAEECRKFEGCEVLELACDVANFDKLKLIIEKTVEKFGGIDVLVNNAGIAKNPSLSEVDEYQQVMDINLRAPVFLSKYALPHLKESRGCVINVSSCASSKVNISVLPYSLTKIALDHFTRGFAAECAAFGVRVNCINPGVVRTSVFEDNGGDINDYLKDQPLGAVEVEEVADSILFICSADHMTGSCVLHDGGYVLP